MLKRHALTLIVGVATISGATAQQPPANQNAPSNPPVTTPAPSGGTPAATDPVPGANSFTEMQAKARLENHGFTGVTGLMKDKDGIWRGMGTKGGRSMNVSVDYRGNVVEK